MKLIYFTLFLSLIILLSACSGNKNNTEAGAETTKVDTTASISDLDEQIRNDPSNAGLLHQRARWYIEKQRYQDALADMNKVMSIDSTQSPFFITLADLAFAANRSFDAKSYLEKAIELDPKNTEAKMRLAELNLIVRQYGQSVALLNDILAEDKSNTTAYLMRGINYKENGDTNKAIDDFRSAIEADADYYDAYMQLGIIFQLRNDPVSEGYFTNAIRIRPNSEEALYGRGLWYQDHEQFDKAIQDYTSIVQSNPNYSNAHFNLGYIHHVYLKVYSEAIKHYTRAIETNPNYAEAYYNRGLCYEAIGNLQNSVEDYKNALKVRPVYPPAEEGLKRVTN